MVTVGNLIARKRHADVLQALTLLPGTRYVIVGDGPERPALERLAARLGVDVSPSSAARSRRSKRSRKPRRAGAFVLADTEEAFGVAYIEAMAGGVPRSARRASPGRRRSRQRGRDVPRRARRPAALAEAIRSALADPGEPPARTSRRTSPGSSRRGPAPPRGRAETKPVLFVTNHAPRSASARSWRCTSARTSSSR